MSRIIIEGMVEQFNRAAGFYDKFIEICPDEVWAKPFGKFPIWQTVYHAAFCVGFFIRPKVSPVKVAPLYSPEVALFKEIPNTPGDKKEIAEYMRKVTAEANLVLNTMTDASLPGIHEGLTSRLGREFTVAGTITGLVGHHMYHFGMCDAALRDAGLEGLF